ncbi:MAG TPA: NosD domain-containing protein, partial [Clostridia bacterium]|nr:NosD domain-containing protein [Clostridia bacterium]
NYMAQTGDLYNNDGFENRTDSKGGVVADIKGGGSIQNVTISDNYFWGCYYGVRITSSKFTNFTIYNNQFVQSVGSSIYITDSVRNTIESNFIQSHPEMGMYNIYIGNNDEETVIRNNVIWNRGRPSSVPNWEKYEDLNVVFD